MYDLEKCHFSACGFSGTVVFGHPIANSARGPFHPGGTSGTGNGNL